jgi:hypothetical protein
MNLHFMNRPLGCPLNVIPVGSWQVHHTPFFTMLTAEGRLLNYVIVPGALHTIPMNIMPMKITITDKYPELVGYNITSIDYDIHGNMGSQWYPSTIATTPPPGNPGWSPNGIG